MIKKIGLMLLFYSLGAILLSKLVSAYINPGTGSAIAGTLWPLIIIIFSTIGAFLIKNFWNPIKKLFSRNRNKKEKEIK